MSETTNSNPAPSFEQSLARLEEIVRSMEGGELSLEDMMAGFEEGTGLVKLCTKRLNDVEKKIEKLVKKDGDVGTEPFAPETENGSDG